MWKRGNRSRSSTTMLRPRPAGAVATLEPRPPADDRHLVVLPVTCPVQGPPRTSCIHQAEGPAPIGSAQRAETFSCRWAGPRPLWRDRHDDASGPETVRADRGARDAAVEALVRGPRGLGADAPESGQEPGSWPALVCMIVAACLAVSYAFLPWVVSRLFDDAQAARPVAVEVPARADERRPVESRRSSAPAPACAPRRCDKLSDLARRARVDGRVTDFGKAIRAPQRA